MMGRGGSCCGKQAARLGQVAEGPLPFLVLVSHRLFLCVKRLGLTLMVAESMFCFAERISLCSSA
jgi:hypothetical protein